MEAIQLVQPKECRDIVLCLAHEVPLSGHLGVTKTKNRILQRYYWPGVFKDVVEYCWACELCHLSTPRKLPRAELIPMPLVTCPFERMAMDLIGPLLGLRLLCSKFCQLFYSTIPVKLSNYSQ